MKVFTFGVLLVPISLTFLNVVAIANMIATKAMYKLVVPTSLQEKASHQ